MWGRHLDILSAGSGQAGSLPRISNKLWINVADLVELPAGAVN